MSNFGRNIGLNEITPVVKNLILLNVFVAAVTYFYPVVTLMFANHFPTSPYFGQWQIVTSIFTHFGFMHLAFNMFSLYMFGSGLEQAIGAKRFLFLYLFAGVGAGLICWIFDAITIYNYTSHFLLREEDIGNNAALLNIFYTHSAGASGAIFGVMTAFAFLFPNTVFINMLFPIPVKTKVMVPMMIIFSYVAILRGQSDGIGHLAHLGGALLGFLLMLYWNKTNKKDFF